MQIKIKRYIFLREAELVIQPLLFWLCASPDRLIYDKEYSDHIAVLQIKSPCEIKNTVITLLYFK